MIIVRLIGGLGNQMFQYAAARRLAQLHNVSLKLDLGWFENIENVNTSRRYELHVFNILADTASPEEVALLKKDRMGVFPGVIKKIMNAINLFQASAWIREKHYQFDPEILRLPDNVYLEGYWQSEKYFKDFETLIRKEFKIKAEPDDRNRGTAEAIKNFESVSIHVRRGDYVSNPAANQYHGTCSLDYYRQAVEKIVARLRHPHFFIFSDDPAWVKDNLKLSCPTAFIEHNGPDKAYEDLRLMSLCKHHIIANSSFSWWGAWLCENPVKIVLAPPKWFNDPTINTTDLLPDSWIRVF